MKDMSVKGNTPRVLLVSGIFPPDVGGPATHVAKIAEHLAQAGCMVTVVAFGEGREPGPGYRILRTSRRMWKPLSWLAYAFCIFQEALHHEVLYAFDLTTAGVPTAFAAHLFNRTFLLRIGGDPIWERVTELGKRFLPMRAYYEQKLFALDKPLLFNVMRYVVRSADRVVTYCDFLRMIYTNFYGVLPEKLVIIQNPVPASTESAREVGTFTFIFAGRFVSYKNLPRVLRAFTSVNQEHPHTRLLLIGDGPDEALVKKEAEPLGALVAIVPAQKREALFKSMSGASVALAPALTEFSPNFILEALSLGKPALISRDNGLSVRLPDAWQFDPLSDESLVTAMKGMLAPGAYAEACKHVAELPKGNDWKEVLNAHERLIKDLYSHQL